VQVQVRHQPSFAVARCLLAAGEPLRVESGAMLATSSGVQMEASMQGGLFQGLRRAALGGESLFVTTYTETPEEIWRDYNRRSDMENRIAELKHDLGAGGFCLKQFFATEAAFRAILLLFNLLAEFQRAANLPRYREPATLRTQILTCGAILGRAGRRLVLHLSQSWGGLKTRTPLLDNIFFVYVFGVARDLQFASNTIAT